MDKIIIGALILSMGAAMAEQECKVTSDYRMSIEEDGLSMVNETGTYRINEKNQFFVDDKLIELSRQEQAWVKDYKENYNHFVQRVSTIALESADFGISIATEAMAAVVSSTDKDLQVFKARLETLKAELKDSIKKQQVWSEAHLEAVINSQFADKVEQLAEEMAEKIPQKLFSFSFWKNLATLEEKMEKFEQDVEKRSEVFEEYIEKKAEALKQVIADLDKLENQLAKSNPALSDFDIFKGCESGKMTSISFN